MSRSVRTDRVGGARTKGAQGNAEGAGNHAQRFDDAEDAGRGDGAHADVAHIARVNLRGGHGGDGHDAGIDRHVDVAAEEPDERDENEVGQNAAGAKDHGAAQAHHVAEAEDESDGVEVEDHAAAIGEGAHEGNELQVEIFAPHVKSGDEEIVKGGDAGGLQQHPGLRAAAFAGDENFSDGCGFRERELAVHLAHEEAAQRNDEEHAETSAGETDEDGFDGIRAEVKDVERGEGKDRARHHRGRRAADAGDDDILKQTGPALVHAGQPDGEDGDGNGGFHALADLERGVGRGDGKDDAEEDAPENGAGRHLRRVHLGLNDRSVGFAGLQRQIGVFRKCFSFLFARFWFGRFWFTHESSLNQWECAAHPGFRARRGICPVSDSKQECTARRAVGRKRVLEERAPL